MKHYKYKNFLNEKELKFGKNRVLLQFILFRQLIKFVQSADEPTWKGYFYAVAFSIVLICYSLLVHQYYHQTFCAELNLRTVLASAVYKKSLRLSNSARRHSTVGEIVNLMAVDVERMTDMATYLNMIWSAPLQVSITICVQYINLTTNIMKLPVSKILKSFTEI